MGLFLKEFFKEGKTCSPISKKKRGKILKEQRKDLTDELNEIGPRRDQAQAGAEKATESLASKGEVFEK